MHERSLPRPATASAAGYLMVGVAFFGFVRGTYLLNVMFHEEPPKDVLPWIFLVPLVAGLCAFFIFRGANWARLVFWLLVGPLAVAGYVQRHDALNLLYMVVYVVAAILLALPNSHWFFTRRDFHRRPGYRAHFDEKQQSDGGKRERQRFEY